MPVQISLLPDGTAADAASAEFPGSVGPDTRRYSGAEIVAAGLSSATPAPTGTASAGVATTASRGDHTHAHGTHAGGTLHAEATPSAAGFMSAADKTKLDAIEAGADVTDAANVAAAGAVMEADFTATHSVLVRQGGPTPAAVSVPVSRLLGRESGDVAALTPAQVRALLDYPAAEVSFDPAGTGLAATNVQAAIAEVAASGGGGGATTIPVVEGFTTSDYFSASGIAPGTAAGFSAVWYGIVLGSRVGGGQYLFSRYLSGAGWSLAIGGAAPGLYAPYYVQAYLRDGSGDLGVTGAAIGAGLRHVALTYDGTTLRLYIDGNPVEFTATGSGFTAAATDLIIGNTPVWGEPHTRGGCVGAGYVETVLTREDLQDHLQACRDANNAFAAGDVSWLHRYDAANPGAGFPTTWEDLAGAGDLSRVGTAITGTTNRGVL